MICHHRMPPPAWALLCRNRQGRPAAQRHSRAARKRPGHPVPVTPSPCPRNPPFTNASVMDVSHTSTSSLLCPAASRTFTTRYPAGVPSSAAMTPMAAVESTADHRVGVGHRDGARRDASLRRSRSPQTQSPAESGGLDRSHRTEKRSDHQSRSCQNPSNVRVCARAGREEGGPPPPASTHLQHQPPPH